MRRIALFFLPLLLTLGETAAQNVHTMASNGHCTLHIAEGQSVTIMDPGGNGDYPNGCNTTVTVICDDNKTLTVSGTYSTEHNTDILSLYDGLSSEAPVMTVCSGVGAINFQGVSNALTLHFFSDVFVASPGFSVTVTATDTTATGFPGGSSPPPCIDFADLHSDYVIASHGTFLNPHQTEGLVDSGYSSPLSRHTLHSDTSERDAHTGHLLRTIPHGHSTSVRLGNWLTGGEAESVTYRFRVDTTVSDLLILRYAAVLENPGHSAHEQPSFAFKIFDTNYVEIDPTCYSSTFVASAGLGWNVAHDSLGSHPGQQPSTVLWKDWTAVGIDLTPLHGQTLLVRLTSRDCARQEHYGYAYFTLDCSNKHIATLSCGSATDHLFTAPDGFAYRWYPSGNSDTTLGTGQTLHVSQTGQYICELSFTGSGGDDSCSFDISITATERHPAASFEMVQWSEDCISYLTLHNNSEISLDAAHDTLTGQPCDSITWTVDGIQLPGNDTIQLPMSHGQHTISLIASLTGGCNDTASQQIFIDYPCHYYDTVTAEICYGESFILFDTTLTESGIYHRDSLMLHRTLFLTVHPTYAMSDTARICQDQLPYNWCGMVIDSTETGPSELNAHLLSLNGCDSSLSLELTVLPVYHTHLADTVCPVQLPYSWHDTTVTAQVSGTIPISRTYTSIHSCDSTVTMHLTILSNSALTFHDTIVENCLPHTFGGLTFEASHTDTTWTIANAAGCDSIITYSLHVWENEQTAWDVTVCEDCLPFTVGNISYYAATQTSWTLNNIHGADSTVFFTLTVNPSYYPYFQRTVCQDEVPLTWHDVAFDDNTPGTDTVRLFHKTTKQCDSITTLVLDIKPTYTIYDTMSICQDALPFTWCDTTMAVLAAGTTDVVTEFHTINSCDSTLSLNLTVFPTYHFHFADTVCNNELPYVWLDTTLSSVPLGVNTIDTHLPTVNLCDSLLTLDLTVFPESHAYHHALVCDGVPYTWIDGNTYSHSTHSPVILGTNASGCDSTTHLILDLEQGFQAKMEVSPREVSTTSPQVTLRDISPSGSRCWYFDGRSDTARVCQFDFPVDKDSLVILLVARSYIGCIDSLQDVVRCDRAAFYVPNAFTPDESINNRFMVFSNALASAEIWLYSRNGLLVAHFDGLTGSWDGTRHGIPCPQGAYTWHLTYTTIAQPRQQRQAKGTVTLIR